MRVTLLQFFLPILRRKRNLIPYRICSSTGIPLTRSYSDGTSNSSNFIKLYEKSFTVYPGFGKLLLNSKCSCIIQPASHQDYPDANYASITLCGRKDNGAPEDIEAEVQGQDDILKFDVPYITEGLCKIYVPFKYDIEADLEDGSSFEVQNMESDLIEVRTKEGAIKTKNIKSRDILLTTDSGPITAAGVLRGNVHITAKRTILKAQRLQGLEFSIQAGHLQTEIESSYMSKGTIFAESGQVNIKHLHGSTELHLQNGRTSINGLSGSLEAILGDVDADIQVSRIEGNSLIQINSGNLSLSLPDASSTNLDVSSPSVEAPDTIQSLGMKTIENGIWKFRSKSTDSSSHLRVHVNEGTVKMAIVDWFSSLGIKYDVQH